MADTLTREQRSRCMSLIRSKDTKPEWVVRRLLHRLGFRYRLHVESLPGTPDLIFPTRRKAIFVSGCFWHAHKCGRRSLPKTRRAYWTMRLNRNMKRDQAARRDLKRLGWSVLTVWECQLKGTDQLTKRLVRFLESE
jgi:DNA mismatch endonuclease, patch repair protein